MDIILSAGRYLYIFIQRFISFYNKYTIINHYNNIIGKDITTNSITYTAYNKTCVYLLLTSLNIRKKIYCVYLHNFLNLYTYLQSVMAVE